MTGRPVAADPRLEFIYREALRGLTQQQAVVESLLNRAGILIFALSFANSLLGARALADGLGAWDWVALGSLVGVGGLAVVMLWPYYNFWFRFDPRDLIERLILRMRVSCQVALVLLLVNLVMWLLSIAAAGG
jgi:hypothetical protein